MGEERFNMKMETYTMDNGMMAKFMALDGTSSIRMTGFMKDFGRRVNTVDRSQRNSPFHFNFSDFNNIFTIILLTIPTSLPILLPNPPFYSEFLLYFRFSRYHQLKSSMRNPHLHHIYYASHQPLPYS